MQKSEKVAHIHQLLNANKGKFLSVTFVKKDGSLRTINGKQGKKEDHTGHNNVAHLSQYATIVEQKQDGSGEYGQGRGSFQFRNVDVSKVTHLKIGGQEYNW